MIDAIPRNCLGKIDRKSLLAKICESKGKDADWFACVCFGPPNSAVITIGRSFSVNLVRGALTNRHRRFEDRRRLVA
jgi:hypothetical protein